MAAAGTAAAQVPIQPSSAEASEIAGEMYVAYTNGGVAQMLAVEQGCWAEVAKDEVPNKGIAALCVTTGLSGAFIESAIARRQGRGAHPDFQGAAVRDRALNLSGLSEEDAEEVIAAAVENQDAILGGLVAAGMR